MDQCKNMIALLGAAILILASGCDDKKLETVNAAPASHAAPPPSLPASPPVTAHADEPLIVSGPLIVEHQVDVTSQRDGIITSISTDAGVRVKRGAILAQLDDRQLTSNLAAARAKTRSIDADLKNWQTEQKVMEADYRRAQQLWDLKLLSEADLAHAKFKAESELWDIKRVEELQNSAQQDEKSLELEIEKTRITAPFDGLVARRYIRSGQAVTKGDRLFWVTAEAPLRMRFTLPERFVGHLKPGQQWAISSVDVPLEIHKARIVAVSPVVDPGSGTIEVQVELLGPPGGLRPGMTANVTVVSPK